MTDLPPFYKQVIKRLGNGDPYLQPADIIAVGLQESDGDPTFSPGDPLYVENMKAAMVGTTLPEQLIFDALKITHGPLQNLIPKFRFEPGYWEWSRGLGLPSATLRFLVSCSFGVGQQMMRWVLPPNQRDWPIFIDNFKSDVDVQIVCLIHTFRPMLINAKGNFRMAYRQYNSGDPNSKDPNVVGRALHAAHLRDIVVAQLKG